MRRGKQQGKPISRLSILFFCVFFVSCHHFNVSTNGKTKNSKVVGAFQPLPTDFLSIKRRSKLRVIAPANSMSYFHKQGTEFGFDYNLARRFAKSLELQLEVVTPPSRVSMMSWLAEGGADLMIAPMPTHDVLPTDLAYTAPVGISFDAIVSGASRKEMNSPDELDGKTVYVIKNSPQHAHLRWFEQSRSIELNVLSVEEDASDLDLVRRIEKRGGIAIIDGRFAKAATKKFAGITMIGQLPRNYTVSWVLPAASTTLRSKIDRFVSQQFRVDSRGKSRGSKLYNVLFRFYYKNPKMPGWELADKEAATKLGAISPFDNDVRSVAQEFGLDWRLLLAMVHEESNFDPKAVSKRGARGLMQLMPATFASMGFDNIYDVKQNLTAGAMYTRLLFRWTRHLGLSHDEQIRFVLASYNGGIGHVKDARKLASKLGLPHDRFEDGIGVALRLLAKKKYYSAAKYGFCRGSETTDYVRKVQARYELYKKLVTL